MPTFARPPAMSAPVRARCFGVGVDGAGVGVAGGASVGVLHYMKPSARVSSACRTLM